MDETYVYWGSAGNAPDGGFVSRVPRGGGSTTTLASGQNVCGIAVHDANVYWTNCNGSGYPGAVMRASAGGGAAITIASDQDDPYAIAVDPSGVYWVNSDVPRAGQPQAGP